MIVLQLALAGQAMIGDASWPPLLDGECAEMEWRRAPRTHLGQGVALLMLEDSRAIHLCLRLPPESLGTFDLYFEDEAGERHNLHSSAQVGERRWTGSAWPEWQFGNHRGWFSPPVPFTGYQGSGNERTVRFAPRVSRELTLLKSRFRLPARWRFMLEVRAIGPGRRGQVTYPANASANHPESWATARRPR